MKKTLLALALLGAFAATASAADVSVYGRIDLGVSYQNTKLIKDGADYSKNDTFTLDSGNSTGSRWGIKGGEDLGNNWKVGFVLENGFKADDGTMTDGLFARESTLSITGPIGTIYAGRMGTLISDAGSVGFYAGTVSPFGSGWGSISGHTAIFAAYTTRFNNTLAYVSPTFNGLTVYAQYAMGNSDENNSTNDRYYALGAKYAAGNLELAGLVDWTNKTSYFKTGTTDNPGIKGTISPDDTVTFNLGGSYDFGVVKAFAAAQYFLNSSDPAGITSTVLKTQSFKDANTNLDAVYKSGVSADGWGLNLGLTAPVGAGTLLVSAGYMDGDADFKAGDNAFFNDEDGKIGDVKAYAFSVGYTYPFSKRTSVYGAAGYTYKELKATDFDGLDKGKSKNYQFMTGIVHKF